MAERRQGGGPAGARPPRPWRRRAALATPLLVLAAAAAAMLVRSARSPHAMAPDPGLARADALHALGQAALREQRLDDAGHALEEARRLHRAQDRSAALAKDALALAQLQLRRGQAAEALRALDECVAEARRGDDAETEGQCHLAAARALLRAGNLTGAQQALDGARPRLPSRRDQAWLLYEQGRLDQAATRGRRRAGGGAPAVARFEAALALALRAGLTDLALTLRLELADALAGTGAPGAAARHLAEAAALDGGGGRALDRARLAAQIAYRRGDLAGAASIHERVWPALRDGDDRIAVAVTQARIALAGGDLAAAESWARRAVAAAEAPGEADALAELRPWVRAARREPFEVLFAVLARAGRAGDAIAVLDRWQGRALLDALARPSDPSGLADAAARLASVERWLPAAATSPLLSAGSAAPRLAAALELVALAVAEGDVWRLTASRGRLRLERIGAVDELGELPERFTAAPTDRALAGELGARLLPEDVVRATGEPLYVVLAEPLARLPVAALRRDGRPLIAARPVVHLPRLPAGACEARGAAGGATVLADAAGDLADSRREAGRIASLLGATPRVGAAATGPALLAARADRVLHLAVRGEASAGGGALRLRDRSVSALEIAAARLGPPLVFLSASDPARSIDPALAGSLATAFLAGGSSHVVASLRAASDPGARELADRFYAAGGARDPVRALARVQAELAGTDDPGWPSLAVFGAGACAAD